LSLGHITVNPRCINVAVYSTLQRRYNARHYSADSVITLIGRTLDPVKSDGVTLQYYKPYEFCASVPHVSLGLIDELFLEL